MINCWFHLNPSLVSSSIRDTNRKCVSLMKYNYRDYLVQGSTGGLCISRFLISSITTTSKGKRKIEIKKIEKPSSRHVTFCKRRSGLFKKATELSILSGAQIAILIQSQSSRVFSFGCPTPDAVIHRLLSGGSVEGIPMRVVHGAEECNRRYAELCKELEVENRKGEMEYTRGGQKWFEDEVEGKGVEELEDYATAMDELRRKVTTRADELSLIRNLKSLQPAEVAVEVATPLSAVLDDFDIEEFCNNICSMPVLENVEAFLNQYFCDNM